MIRQYELVERVRAYDPTTDEDALNRAYVYAMRAHGAQTRASGDPYFSHPLEVAGILTDMSLDHSTIITALLHDTVEDTSATLTEIQELFGDEVGRLVDGVTKLNRIEIQSDRTMQAENLRKLVIAMSDDIRVLLVKLCDRLHNMRTLSFIASEEKRQRIAAETMDIYAPLAERIGVQEIRDELEDLAFRQLNADAYETITHRLEHLTAEGGNIIVDIVDELTETCEKAGLRAEISGRKKSPFSVWLKMRRKNVAIEQLSDIVAFRLIVDNEPHCYQALGIIHRAYPLMPGRFKDYISTPKPNGYRSLHTGVIGPKRQRVEIQIRTREMHEIAELGVAAHWVYKEGDAGVREGRQYRWLRELLEILEQASGPEEFLEHTKLEMYQDLVFCFSPKGDLISLPRGASPVDFAYAVHSEVGNTCVGTKINGGLRPLTTELKNGDQVEIATSKTSTPSPTWEQFVVTGKAKAAIRRFVRHQKREQFCNLGKAIIQKTLRQEGVRYSEKMLHKALGPLPYEHIEDLLAGVGEGLIPAKEVLHAAIPEREATTPITGDGAVPISKVRKKGSKNRATVPLTGLIPGMAVHYARCCHPLPGERIVGIVTTGKGVTVHTIDCETLEGFQSMPELWLGVAWDMAEVGPTHIGRLGVILANEPGSLGELSTIIGKNGGNIVNLKISNRSVDFFEMQVDVEVENVRHLTNIIAALRATPMITSVERARG
ncbi:MAG: bifunctional (p)ppGpp synthetase/guanosine-3',5'-bis(diphosphate) 3'-pyrophosphohydrolase [Rhodospirillaceae bacterium]|nr:bifunctional (p)ppGpp synthetase/guanosine-3',5'-bis(diphosphate) 3'-pyrophosphohydrolase [Rhodospirillaceae bacterium]